MRIEARTTIALSMMSIVWSAFEASAAPFSNGSFETPGIVAGVGPVTFSGGSSLGAWTVTGGSVDYGATGAQYQGQAFTAFDGSYGIDVTGAGLQRGGGVQQTFDVLPSRRYRLTFVVGRFSSTLPNVGGISTVGVKLNGVDLGIFVNDLVNPAYSWKSQSLDFQTDPAQTSVTLQLFDSNTGGATTHVGLDAVTVTLLPPVVPMLSLAARAILLATSVLVATGGLASILSIRRRRA